MTSRPQKQLKLPNSGSVRQIKVLGFTRLMSIGSAVALAVSLAVVLYIAAFAGTERSAHGSTDSNDRSFEFISLGHIGGPANALETDGAYAYVGFANELAVVDVLTGPKRLGYVLVGSRIEDIFLGPGYAYIAAGESGLWIVNIQNPENPEIAGHLDTPGYAHGLTKEGNVIYLADGVEGLRTISVIDPTTPVDIGNVHLPAHGLGVASSGRYAYVAIAEKGLQVVDVVNPSQPVLKGRYDTDGSSLGVVVQEEFAYVADGLGGLQIIDITDPVNPDGIAGLGVGGAAKDLTLDDGLAYIAADSAGLVIIDVTSPLDLNKIGTLSTTSRSISTAKYGQTVFLANWSEGLQMVDVSSPSNPLWVNSYDPPANTRGGIDADGRTIYVGDDTGIKIIDMAVPLLPVLKGNEWIQDGSTNLALDHDLLYVTGGYSGLHIIDVSESLDPETIGNLDTPGFASDVALRDEYAFIADFDSGVRSVDITTPTNPVELSSLSVEGSVVAVDVVGNTLFVAASSGGLRLVDTADPLNLVEVGHYPTAHNVRDVDAQDEFAYIAEGGAGLTILDVSNPSEPSIISRMSGIGYGLSVIVDGQFAYVSDDRGRVRVIDVASPFQPEIVATYRTPATRTGVSTALSYGDAYLATDGWGLFVTSGDLAIQGIIVDHNDRVISSVQVEGSFGRSGISAADGRFSVGSYLPGPYVITPTQTNRAFVPSSLSIDLPQDSQLAQIIVIPAPITTTVGITQEVEFGYFDVQGLPTSFTIPTGAFTSTTLMVVTPTLARDTPEALFAGHAFVLDSRTGMAAVDHFAEPISISISYSDFDIQGVANEAELWLRWWDGDSYRDAAESCVPASQYQREIPVNVLSIAVCQSAEYVLMGPINNIFLPLVLAETD